jgi:GNAT superfamily N-acetyltransferase
MSQHAPTVENDPQIQFAEFQHEEDYPAFERPGFELTLDPVEDGNFAAKATGYYNTVLDRRPSGEPVLEDGVFDLNFVYVPESMSRKGVGSLLVQAALDHAADKGLEMGRAHVMNARMLRILRNLAQHGVIGDLVIVDVPADEKGEIPKLPLGQLLDRPQLDPSAAETILAVDTELDGFSNGPGVEVAFRLPQAGKTQQLKDVA